MNAGVTTVDKRSIDDEMTRYTSSTRLHKDSKEDNGDNVLAAE